MGTVIISTLYVDHDDLSYLVSTLKFPTPGMFTHNRYSVSVECTQLTTKWQWNFTSRERATMLHSAIIMALERGPDYMESVALAHHDKSH